MPKTKKQNSSDSDSGPEDRNPPPSKKSKLPKTSSNDGEEDSWSLGKSRFVKLREFKGKFYVDIREYYEADGELKPGKKGISMSLEQWRALGTIKDEIDECIKKKC